MNELHTRANAQASGHRPQAAGLIFTRANITSHPNIKPVACGLKPVALAFFLFSLISTTAFAQQKPFSSDQALFLQEMTDFLVTADKKEGRPFMEEVFAPVWNGSYYSAQQRVKITEVANYMLKKRFEAFPSFRDYLAALAAFPTTGRSGA